ncbi:MAG: V-type ATP synthase subunit F [Clostridiales bacterium]|jgi:V/A-type H+-transporting ATPase subunit F|nr:V-type ATP synthase subunit F [Clostridiales bacterium]
MKLFLISDNIDTQAGMRLAGIESVVVHTREDVSAALGDALKIPDLGILLITEKLAGLVRDALTELKLSRALPLVVEIPDRHGTKRLPNSITRYVNESIGIKF